MAMLWEWRYSRELHAKFRCVASKYSSETYREVGLGVRPTRYTTVGLGFKDIDA